MEFLRERVYSAVNADELSVGDKVIVADTLTRLKEKVEEGYDICLINKIYPETDAVRISVKAYSLSDVSLSYNLAYLVERKENCTNCEYEGSAGCSIVEICGENKLTHRCHMYEAKDTKRNLCNSCKFSFAECSVTLDDIIFGDGVGNDNVYACDKYEQKAEPPANCETCSKADTDRCPVPNPPKETGCCHWESKPARVCENCRKWKHEQN